ncbi:methionyl-tRNA formyltransferase [Patescibacteria group bacterium]|nr:methionyl-tRNA formyltransferase [Patescibacteria group bacterium]
MTKKQNKIIFFGTPKFASIILQKLIKSQFQPLAVVTAPDKPVGRKQTLTPSSVKELALKYQIPFFQPASLKNNKEIITQLSSLKPDLFIVTAYGLILPQEILDLPANGSLNIHPSLLPQYRGASPIQATILNGETITGITIILMDVKVDHGPILVQQKLKIEDSKIIYSNLSNQLAELGGELIVKTLPKYFKNEIKPLIQDHAQATFTQRLKKQDGQIDWLQSAMKIESLIRAYQPWPGTYAIINLKTSNLNNKWLKIVEADILEINHRQKSGAIFLTKNKNLAVACQQNALILKKIQLPGKQIIKAHDFLNGYPEIIKARLSMTNI